MIKAAAILKVSTLKFWIGRPWSQGSFSGGIAALPECASKFLFKKKTEEETVNESENTNETNPITPTIQTPASASQNTFNKFFDKDVFEKNELEQEVLKLNFQKEVDEFQKLISANNYKIITTLNSTASFWIKNAVKFPLLSKLARLLINIKSSSSCIERFFSICGINSKKNRGNIGDDLFVMRCLLRANIDILKELNNISF